ncbi:hypothetical protein [Streptomyces sp. AM 2-1-1]|uniref:hypothetical protein n=1 Tax=Streptomyces sp. AM 2-1-1 TaxID=3028709 RepID=UPI0023B92510|nr:hypothetical protein [Streptomyces sp. AM 2-1-1]WEH40062.1 hypothetical protein PZB77_11350 [Streptomyces sp. AM 2-1-1]
MTSSVFTGETGKHTPRQTPDPEPGHHPPAASCARCEAFDLAEEAAERADDLSAATDCRVLRVRHLAADPAHRGSTT